MVAPDHRERATLRRSFGRELPTGRDEAVREQPGDRRHHRDADEEQRPPAREQEQPAERRAHHDAEVRRDAHVRVPRFVALRRHEIGNERLTDRPAQRRERAGHHHQPETERDVVTDEEEQRREKAERRLTGEHQPASAEVVGQMPACVADDPGRERTHEETDRELA